MLRPGPQQECRASDISRFTPTTHNLTAELLDFQRNFGLKHVPDPYLEGKKGGKRVSVPRGIPAMLLAMSRATLHQGKPNNFLKTEKPFGFDYHDFQCIMVRTHCVKMAEIMDAGRAKNQGMAFVSGTKGTGLSMFLFFLVKRYADQGKYVAFSHCRYDSTVHVLAGGHVFSFSMATASCENLDLLRNPNLVYLLDACGLRASSPEQGVETGRQNTGREMCQDYMESSQIIEPNDAAKCR
jgi:hypothetical protein